MYILSEELKSLYQALLRMLFLNVFSIFFSPPVMLQAGSGSGLKSVGRIRIRNTALPVPNTPPLSNFCILCNE